MANRSSSDKPGHQHDPDDGGESLKDLHTEFVVEVPEFPATEQGGNDGSQNCGINDRLQQDVIHHKWPLRNVVDNAAEQHAGKQRQ